MEDSIYIQSSLSYLHGFLKALQIFTGRKVILSANIYVNTGNLELDVIFFLKYCEIEFDSVEVTPISREQCKLKIKYLIYSNLPTINDSVIKDIDWYLEECYGLISTSIDENGAFSPLCSLPIYSVSISKNIDNFVFIIVFPNYVLINFIEKN